PLLAPAPKQGIVWVVGWLRDQDNWGILESVQPHCPFGGIQVMNTMEYHDALARFGSLSSCGQAVEVVTTIKD
ncbi:hypothetical protein OFB51_26570, partial [Escherichia coli]|nr:hypothetical protein [Escherichia coli]